MADKLYLLVCEGPTDSIVLEKVAKKISEDSNNSIEIRELSPQRDASTGRYPKHGWEEVRQWCRLYGKSTDISGRSIEALKARGKKWQALVALSNANGLIIQIDTDIAEYIVDLLPLYRGSTKRARKNFLKRAILSWLGESTLPDKVYILLSTYSTENWILATYDRIESIFDDLPENFDFEDIENALERLFNLGYDSYIDPVTGKEKLNKDLNIYKQYAKHIMDNLEKVRIECEEVDNICLEFEG